MNKIKAKAGDHGSYDDFLIWILRSNWVDNIGIDPNNKGCLGYDEFHGNLCNIVPLTHPEAYVIFKNNKQQDKLSMKQLFKSLGGAWFKPSLLYFNYHNPHD